MFCEVKWRFLITRESPERRYAGRSLAGVCITTILIYAHAYKTAIESIAAEYDRVRRRRFSV
jgi:hypothetical protein